MSKDPQEILASEEALQEHFKRVSMPSRTYSFNFGVTDVAILKRGKKEKITFTFDHADSSPVTHFVDRPDRVTGQHTMKNFANDLAGYWEKDSDVDFEEPNAFVSHWSQKLNPGMNGFSHAAFEIEGMNINKRGKVFIKTDLTPKDIPMGMVMPSNIEMATFNIETHFIHHPVFVD